ncbi:MAG TPA: Ig-like domain-containing protein [Longimicrobium sp.]|nr:Ig-like domain-containing protein [Longimicrobium sp.]
MRPSRALRAAAIAFAVLAAAACTDKSSPLGPDGGTPPPTGPGAPPITLAALDCTGNKLSLTVSCVPAASQAGTAAGDIIVGNQNVYVRLVSTNITYNAGTGQFSFDATLENLIEQPLGTVDGTTPDPAGIRIFFYTAPATTGGTGTVAVIPDGFAFFTAAAQPYFTYPYVLDQNEISPNETWNFIVPPTVTSFHFSVLVSAPVEYPTGYITLNAELPGYDYGNLHPSTPYALTALVKNPLGETIPGTVTFGTSNPDCASVSVAGLVTGVQAATCSITATSGALAGEMVFDVTGTTRTWNGSVSADWSNGANWNGGYAPVAADSAIIPAGTPSNPALTATVALGGLTVADVATLTLGTHNLTLGANLLTGTTGGVVGGGAGVLDLNGTGTAQGRVPSLWVTGDYTLNGDLLVVAPQSIRAGRMRNPSYQLRIVSQ